MAEGEKFDIGKLFRGFNIFNGAALGTMMHQVVIILVVLAVAVGVWYKMFGQRTENTTQNAQQITNIEEKQDGFRVLGVELLGWRK